MFINLKRVPIYPLLSLVFLVFFGALTGCTSFPQETVAEDLAPPKVEPQRPLIGFIVDSPEGSRGSFDDPVFGPGTTVQVGRAYLSALGVQCKQAVVTNNAGQSETIAVCLEGGVWQTAPRIWGTSIPDRGAR